MIILTIVQLILAFIQIFGIYQFYRFGKKQEEILQEGVIENINRMNRWADLQMKLKDFQKECEDKRNDETYTEEEIKEIKGYPK